MFSIGSDDGCPVPWEGIDVLLNEFKDRLPLPPSFEELRKSGKPSIDLYWVMKVGSLPKDWGGLELTIFNAVHHRIEGQGSSSR